MFNIQNIENVADCTPLYLPHSLYLKPLAKMHISVGLPMNKTGKSISNLEIMDKLSAELKPDKFLVLKVSKSTVTYIRFDAELDEHKRLRNAISRLDGASLKLSGFSESFRVRCTDAKDDFPTRHDWDSYFRDARNMDEMKPGERPDTIHFTHLPIRWFCPRHAERDENPKPSESIFKRIFEKYGRVRCVDIPICDPYRKSMNSDINGMRTFSYEHDVLFEGYVQFDEYAGFVRAMDEFRGCKLVRKFVEKNQAINIGVNFDKTKHLSDAQVMRRERIRKRLLAKAQAEEEELERNKKQEQEQLERERQKAEQAKLADLEKQRQREEKRKEKHLKKIQERGQVEISQKIRIEQRKLIIAQRKLESIRILEQLFDRLKLKHSAKSTRRHNNYDLEEQNKQRERLVEKYKIATEKLLNDQRKIVDDIKTKTPLMGLLKSKSNKNTMVSSDEEVDATTDNAQKLKQSNTASAASGVEGALSAVNPINPFKAVAALAAAGAGVMTPSASNAAAAAAAAAYSAEAASEWMKSLSMFPYAVPGVFPGVSAMYRPPAFPVSANYRGFAPRARGRGGRMGRGRGRGGYDVHLSSYYSNNKYYENDRYEDDGDGYYKASYSSRGRNRSRSSSYSRSRSRSRGRSRRRSYSRSRSRSHYRKSSYSSRSRNRSRSRSNSRSRTKTPPLRTNKKLVSTRRSRSSSDYTHSRSRTRSHSRQHHRSKRSWSRRGNERRSDRRSRSRNRSRSRSRSASPHRVVLETEKLVRSAEQIQRTVEHDTKERMREEEREIKNNFRTQRQSTGSTTNHIDGKLLTTSKNNEIDQNHDVSPVASKKHSSPDRDV